MILPVTLTGIVRSGNRIGRRFDFPTANITPREDIKSLRHGVYFSHIIIDGTEYPAITNLGVRPTVGGDGTVNAETFIYDYDGDIYGRSVSLTLLRFRRDEKKFDSLEDLYEAVWDDFRAGADFFGIKI